MGYALKNNITGEILNMSCFSYISIKNIDNSKLSKEFISFIGAEGLIDNLSNDKKEFNYRNGPSEKYFSGSKIKKEREKQ